MVEPGTGLAPPASFWHAGVAGAYDPAGYLMKSILLAGVSAIALVGGARAADLPVKASPLPPAVWSWSGFYIGLQGGVVSHRGTYEDDGFLFGSANTNNFSTVKHSGTGGIVGGHAGYNWQSGSIVLGVESDISALSAKSTISGIPTFNATVAFDARWLATVRARFGVAVAHATLLYVTGGVAFGHVRNSATPSFGAAFIDDKTRTGWTVGGGIEHMLARNWTVRAEVRYADLGSSTPTCVGNTNCNFTYRSEFSNKLLMGLVGVSLKF